MPKPKKTCRTIKNSYRTGRFTREEIRAAVEAVVRERLEQEAAEKREKRRKRDAERRRAAKQPKAETRASGS